MKKLMGFGILGSVAFISGFILMAFELIGARLLAPAIGSSTYVWTSVIGVIIAALSTGYYLGGKLADRRNQAVDVGLLCLAIAVTIGVMLMLFDQVMAMIIAWQQDQRLRGVFASLALFAPTSLFLGMLSPYLVKRNVTSLTTSGQSVANLSALNSIGGIVGTFVTGFIIFSYIGSREALAVITCMAIVSSWLFVPRRALRLRLVLSFVAMIIVVLPLLTKSNTIRIDTPSAHYEIKTGQTVYGDPGLKYLLTGPNAAQSGIFVNRPNELAFWYTNEIARLVDAAPTKKSILILGGGALTLPEHLAKKYLASHIDVVEIDPALPKIAEDHFDYQPMPNVTIIGDDARAYINTATEQYDVVIVDVYSDTTIPFSLMTQEFGAALRKVMTTDGMVIANVIAGEGRKCKQILQAIDQSYRVAAPYGLISRNPKTTSSLRANYVLIYTKEARSMSGVQPLSVLPGPLYKDNYMPSERLQQACQDE